jgi:hypothetical protein
MKRNLLFLLMLITGIISSSCKKEYSCENCRGTDQPPIAKAGSTQIITLPTDSVTLNGTASSDPDGSIITFLWTKISGPSSLAIANPDSAITKIKNLIQGVYSFELKVTDNEGLAAKDTMNVTVYAAGIMNQPPVAVAGIDQTTILPANSVTIDGGDSYDPDGFIVSYAWSQITGPNLTIMSSSSYVSSVVHNLIQGIYQFELKVFDNGGLSAKDTVQITVMQ